MIKMIISPEYFGINENENAIKKQVRKWGAKNISIDEYTGYISAVMSANDYKDFVLSLRKNVEDTVDKIRCNKEKYTFIDDILCKGDFTGFVVMCRGNIDKRKFDAALELYMASTLYQVMCGIPPELAETEIFFRDADTGNLLDYINSSRFSDN